MRPALMAPPFEVIEAELIFELAILLLDRPPGLRESATRSASLARYSSSGCGGTLSLLLLFTDPGTGRRGGRAAFHAGTSVRLPETSRGCRPSQSLPRFSQLSNFLPRANALTRTSRQRAPSPKSDRTRSRSAAAAGRSSTGAADV